MVSAVPTHPLEGLANIEMGEINSETDKKLFESVASLINLRLGTKWKRSAEPENSGLSKNG
jgi:hypothetical protein